MILSRKIIFDPCKKREREREREILKRIRLVKMTFGFMKNQICCLKKKGLWKEDSHPWDKFIMRSHKKL